MTSNTRGPGLQVYRAFAAWVLSLMNGVGSRVLAEEIAAVQHSSPGVIGCIVRWFHIPERISARDIYSTCQHIKDR